MPTSTQSIFTNEAHNNNRSKLQVFKYRHFWILIKLLKIDNKILLPFLIRLRWSSVSNNVVIVYNIYTPQGGSTLTNSTCSKAISYSPIRSRFILHQIKNRKIIRQCCQHKSLNSKIKNVSDKNTKLKFFSYTRIPFMRNNEHFSSSFLLKNEETFTYQLCSSHNKSNKDNRIRETLKFLIRFQKELRID